MKLTRAQHAATSPSPASLAVPGSVALLCAVSFAPQLPGAMLNPILPDMASGLGVSVAAIGQLSTVASLVGAIAALLMGTLSDLYGRRPFLLGGLVLICLGTFVLAVAPTFGWALASRVLVGLAGVGPVVFALVGDWYRGSSRDQAIGRMVAFIAIAWVVGAPAAAIIAQLGGWRMSVAVCGVLFLVVAGLALVALPNQPPPRQEGGLSVALATIWRSHRRRPDLALALLANSLRTAAWIAFLTYVSILYRGIFQLETWQLGPVLALGAAAYALGSEAAGRLAARTPLRSTLVVALVGMGLSGAVFPSLSFLPLSLAVMTGFCLLSGAADASFTAMVLKLAPASRGATMSLNATLGGVGSALGAAAAGIAIATLGYPGLGIIVLGFALLSLVLISALLRRYDGRVSAR